MSLRPQLDMFAAKLTKFEEVNWLAVFEHADFQAIGLCQRHVQIDDTGRDWFGMPFLEDADCARVQGSPYVAELRGREKQLNDLLWRQEVLAQREHSITARAKYHAYASQRQPGERAYTPAEFFERDVRDLVELGIYASPRLLAKLAMQEGEGLPDFDEAGNSIPSPFEKFISLDFVTQVLLMLAYEIRWQRQNIYFDRLVAREQAELVRERQTRQAQSQAHWAQVDAERARQLEARRQAEGLVLREPAEQLDMFGKVVASG